MEILFRIYAKFLDGGEAALQRLIEAALGYQPDRTENLAAYLPQLVDPSH